MTISIAQAQLFFLALTRVLAILVHAPMLGGRLVPNPVKLGLGLMLAVVMLPWQPLSAGAPGLPWLAFAGGIGRELLIGTLAGFAAALLFGAIQITGSMMGLVSGFNSGQIMNPALEHSGSAMDQIYIMVAMLLFLVLNGHHAFLVGLQATFDVLPLNQPLPQLTPERVIGMAAQLISAGIQMSLPVVGTMLLADLTLGLLARVAPHIQVFFLGVPLKIGLGFIALAITFTLLFPALSSLFKELAPRMLLLLGR